MQKRFVSIWFRYLKTDWFTRRQPALQKVAFVLAAPDHGRMLVRDRNGHAQQLGVEIGMPVADAKAIFSSLEVLDDQADLADILLKKIGEWCIRFTPVVSADPPDGLLLEVTGCTHLWGDEQQYVDAIQKRFKNFGYTTRIAIADTIGTAWAVARFRREPLIIKSGEQINALLTLPPQALRIDALIVERLMKLGLRQISSLINLPRKSLTRRFGPLLPQRLNQAIGLEEEWIINPLHSPIPYQERLPCLEPIVHAGGIEIAIERLLDVLCKRLQEEQKGLRAAVLNCYRTDGKLERIAIGTNRPTCNTNHLFKLFELKIETITPAEGIELFTLDALKVEDLFTWQEKIWADAKGLNDAGLSELLDRIEGKLGAGNIHRYMPAEHYWPERSFSVAESIHSILQTDWKTDRPRPLQVLPDPEQIEVAAPIPDYPPMNFRYKGKLHDIIRADGPERIEPEWWLQEGKHRDYYLVEDQEGHRYWVFRSGHYGSDTHQWFIHGFFA
jgi:protein ImuB